MLLELHECLIRNSRQGCDVASRSRFESRQMKTTCLVHDIVARATICDVDRQLALVANSTWVVGSGGKIVGLVHGPSQDGATASTAN